MTLMLPSGTECARLEPAHARHRDQVNGVNQSRTEHRPQPTHRAYTVIRTRYYPSPGYEVSGTVAPAGNPGPARQAL
jgi:hypothetical protein